MTTGPYGPFHPAPTRLLPALPPSRRSEVLDLRWRDIGEDAINLRDSKTGPRAMPKAGASGFSRTAGVRSARMRSLAVFACMTFAIRQRTKP